MRVMVIVKATQSSEAGLMPSPELLTAMGQFNDELIKAGIMMDGGGLKPTTHGARVLFQGSTRTVTEGPFSNTSDQIAGYWIWKVQSMQEAIEWVKRCPNPMPEESMIEIRPYFEMEDFGDSMSDELKESEASFEATKVGLEAPRFCIRPGSTMAGLSVQYTMENRVEIPKQWGQFVSQALASVPHLCEVFYGVCYNGKADGSFDYFTGLELPENGSVPEGMHSLELVERRYAVFPHVQHVSQLAQTFDLIWNHWVPICGLKVAKAPCFERYAEEFNPETGMGGMEVWIPLE